MQSVQDQLAVFNDRGRRLKKWKKVVTALACIVVFCTVYALILPAITLEGSTYCNKEEHIHTDACYKEMAVSVEQKLVCTIEEVEAHTHSDECYEIQTIEETVEVVVEAFSEDESDEEITAATTETQIITTEEKVLICEKTETAGHAHGDDCYEEVEVYGEAELDCGKEEHEHSKACYSDPDADVETEAEWEKTLEEVIFINDRVEDTLAVAETQLGYCESTKNYIVTEDGKTKGYTRYGDWYGNKYGDWCAMFVSFCLNYAKVEDFPLEAGCQNWILKIKELEESMQYNAWQEADDKYIPERGNIIFFNWDSEADADHVGIVVGTTTDDDGNTTITTIEGNASDTVKYNEYDLYNSAIMGYGILPAQESEELEERVQRVIALIENLPIYDEFETKLLAYEDAGDMDGYEAYYKEIYDLATSAYVLYEDLSEENRAKVANIDKLLDFEWMWTANTFQVEQGIDVYQVNSYDENNGVSGAKTVLFHGMSPDKYGTTMTFAYWSAIVVEEDADGTLYVSECITTTGVDKSAYGPETENGFVLLIWHTTLAVESLDIEVGDIVSVPFDYTKTLDYTGSSYGIISFSDPEGNKDKLTTVQGADTNEFITVNLYDYDSRINDPYNINNKYPGFQQDSGQLKVTSTVDSNFGNNITEDLDAGLEGLTVNGGTTINATIDGGYGLANSPISGKILSTLKDGYPALADGTSLKYLFTANGGYGKQVNTQSVNGLFIYDEVTGAYTFNSRENHAQYNSSNDTFTLYNQIISSNFIWYPFGNFLPFNDIVQQTTQVSDIDREYFQIIADRATAKYNKTNETEYYTLAEAIESWMALMDVKYPDGWDGADAMNEYFNESGPGAKTSIDFDFSTQTDLLNKIYSIDYDEATDFYFGMEMEMNFMQPKDGMTGKDTNNDGESDYPMEFYFTGDDDVWIYIDGVLFLDLSGIHRHVGGTIDFVNGKVHYYALDVTTGDVAASPYKTLTFAEILGSSDGLNEKGTFEDYSTHTFNFYYMERGAGSGVCRMNFNFPLLKQNSISVSKEVTTDTEILGNPDYKFQVLKADADGNKTNELFIAAGTTYNIYDADDKLVGTGETDADGVFTLKAGQRAEFTGIQENSGKYYVRELLAGTVLEQYGKVTVSGESTTTSNSITINSETFTGMDSPVKDMSEGATIFRFTNDVDESKLGTLSIGKKLSEYVVTGDVKYFDIQVKLDGELLSVGTKYTVGEDTRTVETEGIITITAGETATISNILAGTEFNVMETSDSAEGYTVTYTDESGNSYTMTDSYATGVIKAGVNVQLIVTNSEKGTTVTIPGTKTISNPDGSEHTYTFQLTEVKNAAGEDIEGAVSQTTTATVTSEITQPTFAFNINYVTADCETLPQTFYYKITELKNQDSLANNTIYSVEVTVSEVDDEMSAAITGMWKDGVAITSDESYSADFVNTLVGDLILSKTVVGGESSLSTNEYTFEITLNTNETQEYTAVLTTADGNTEEKTIFFSNGEAAVAVKHGETIRIPGIVYGTEWTISEINADGYKVTYEIQANGTSQTTGDGSTSSGSISKETTVQYTNTTVYELPETGGFGSDPFVIGGALLMSMAAFLLYNNKKRREEEMS